MPSLQKELGCRISSVWLSDYAMGKQVKAVTVDHHQPPSTDVWDHHSCFPWKMPCVQDYPFLSSPARHNFLGLHHGWLPLVAWLSTHISLYLLPEDPSFSDTVAKVFLTIFGSSFSGQTFLLPSSLSHPLQCSILEVRSSLTAEKRKY